jgi:hypothetical protein
MFSQYADSTSNRPAIQSKNVLRIAEPEEQFSRQGRDAYAIRTVGGVEGASVIAPIRG